MTNYKVFLIRVFTFIGGLYFVLKFLLPSDNQTINSILPFKDIHEHVVNGFTVVGSLAIGLGILNLVFVHGSKLAYKKSNWIFSAVLLVGLIVMLSVQGLDWYNKGLNAQKSSELLVLSDFSKKIIEDSKASTAGVMPRLEREGFLKKALELKLIEISTIDSSNVELRGGSIKLQALLESPSFSDEAHSSLQEQIAVVANIYREELDKRYSQGGISNFANFLNQGLFVSLGSAMFSLLGFYIAAAAYRAFRIRSVEASLMMFAALIVMLGQIPFGIWISPHFPEFRMWLLQVPSAGAARAIEMGAGIAGLVLAIRMWLSLESGSFKSE